MCISSPVGAEEVALVSVFEALLQLGLLLVKCVNYTSNQYMCVWNTGAPGNLSH